MPSMDEEKTFSRTIRELQATRNAMLRETWDRALEESDDAIQDEADRALAKVQRTLRKFRNKQLQEVLDRLRTNQDDLMKGLKDMRKARQNLEAVQAFLETVSRVVRIAGKVLALAV